MSHGIGGRPAHLMNQQQRRLQAAVDGEVQTVDEQRRIEQGPALLFRIRGFRKQSLEPGRVPARELRQARDSQAGDRNVGGKLRIAIDDVDAYRASRYARQESRLGGGRLIARFGCRDEVHGREPPQVRIAPTFVASAGQAEPQEASHGPLVPGMQRIDGARMPLCLERAQRGRFWAFGARAG